MTTDIDDIFRMMSHQLRRETLCRLVAGEKRSVDIGVLLDWLTDTGRTRREAKLELDHNHLPTLDRVGLVEYDDDAGVVRLATVPAFVRRLCEIVRDCPATD